jgi:hypothetical protein
MFDLGGVVIGIDFGRAFRSWARDARCDPAAITTQFRMDDAYEVLPAGLDENGSASFAEDVSACLHADAKRRRLMTAVTDRRAPKCFL